MPRLDNWELFSISAGMITGEVYEHSKFEDGGIITTSPIVGKLDASRILTQSGSIYNIGAPSKNYESAFPNARERLFNSLSYVQ